MFTFPVGRGHSDMQVNKSVNIGFEMYPLTYFSHDAEITPK